MAAAAQETTRLLNAGVTVTLPGTPGAGYWAVPLPSGEGAVSGAFVRVAMTRTVYCVPGVRPVMVWPVRVVVACRVESYACAPDFHCTL